MKKKGFSLVELLAVIVIISVVALISTPLIMNVINDSKLNSLKDSAYGILKSGNLYYSQYEPETNIRFDIEENQVTSKDAEEMISYKGYVKEGAVIVNATGKITMCITDGKNSVYKNYSDKSIVVVENDSCYIPENQAIVYLANGGATLDELDNAELTDLVTTLQEEISTLNREINTLKTSKANQSDLDTIETQMGSNATKSELQSLATQLASKANQSDLNTTNSNISTMSTQIETIGTIANSSTLDKAYPIGSIYVSVKNTNPSTLFGGTWVSFGTGRTLVGVDTNQTEFASIEKTGGSKTTSYTPAGTVGNTTLTVNQIPAHNYDVLQAGNYGNAIVPNGTNNMTEGNYTIRAYDAGCGWIPASSSYVGKKSWSAGTQNSGGGQAHNHSFTGTGANISTLQPYITVYMWKRTS